MRGRLQAATKEGRKPSGRGVRDSQHRRQGEERQEQEEEERRDRRRPAGRRPGGPCRELAAPGASELEGPD
eukprot:14988256-Alexandrium_andersonii.AAC.1